MYQATQVINFSQSLPLLSEDIFDCVEEERGLLEVFKAANRTLQHTHSYFKYINGFLNLSDLKFVIAFHKPSQSVIEVEEITFLGSSKVVNIIR